MMRFPHPTFAIAGLLAGCGEPAPCALEISGTLGVSRALVAPGEDTKVTVFINPASGITVTDVSVGGYSAATANGVWSVTLDHDQLTALATAQDDGLLDTAQSGDLWATVHLDAQASVAGCGAPVQLEEEALVRVDLSDVPLEDLTVALSGPLAGVDWLPANGETLALVLVSTTDTTPPATPVQLSTSLGSLSWTTTWLGDSGSGWTANSYLRSSEAGWALVNAEVGEVAAQAWIPFVAAPAVTAPSSLAEGDTGYVVFTLDGATFTSCSASYDPVAVTVTHEDTTLGSESVPVSDSVALITLTPGTGNISADSTVALSCSDAYGREATASVTIVAG